MKTPEKTISSILNSYKKFKKVKIKVIKSKMTEEQYQKGVADMEIAINEFNDNNNKNKKNGNSVSKQNYI